MLALTVAVMCLSAPAASPEPAVARFGKPLTGLAATPLSEVLASAKDGDTVRRQLDLQHDDIEAAVTSTDLDMLAAKLG